jgi:hypothetical protein
MRMAGYDVAVNLRRYHIEEVKVSIGAARIIPLTVVGSFHDEALDEELGDRGAGFGGPEWALGSVRRVG